MEYHNQSINESSDEIGTERVPSFVIYSFMITTLISAIIVIIPAVTIINVIWQTRQLHTKYFFFTAHLLATNAIWISVASVLVYIMNILYMLNLNSDSAATVLKWLGIAPALLFYLMIVLLPTTIAVERMIVIAFPLCHRSIVTTKRVASVLAVMWVFSAILIIIAISTLLVDIVWPLGLVHFHPALYAIIGVPRVISIICIMATNGFLQYKIAPSNRKAAENQRLGNEEKLKNYKNALQKIKAQAKGTIMLFLVGGIDIISVILQTVTYAVIEIAVEPNIKVYVLRFSYQLIETCYLLSLILVYGMYMKKIRNRLPNWMVCYQKCIIRRHNRVGIFRQQPQATV